MGAEIAVWVSKNSGFLQSGNFSRMSGIKLQRYLNYRYLSCTFSVKLQRYLNYCDFNRIINRKFTVFFGLS